jgi:hypothetical protein
VLVQPHEDGVVTGLGPRLEVEHHPGSRGRSPPERIVEDGKSPGVRAAERGRSREGSLEAATSDSGEGGGIVGNIFSRVSCAWKRSRVGDF